VYSVALAFSEAFTLVSNYLNKVTTFYKAADETVVAGLLVNYTNADNTGIMCLCKLCLTANLKALLIYYDTSTNTAEFDNASFPLANLLMIAYAP